MWKRTWMLLFVTVFLYCLPEAAMAATFCGASPPLPPEGVIWPVEGNITNSWSLNCLTGRGHRGIDIAAPRGSEVKAAAAGTVSFTGYTPAEGGGATVSIAHPGGLISTYLHLTGVRVAPGQQVSQGETIASSNGPAIHFGIKTGSGGETFNHYYNPLLYLKDIPADHQTSPSPTGQAPEAAPQPAPLPNAGSPAPPPASVNHLSGTTTNSGVEVTARATGAGTAAHKIPAMAQPSHSRAVSAAADSASRGAVLPVKIGLSAAPPEIEPDSGTAVFSPASASSPVKAPQAVKSAAESEASRRSWPIRLAASTGAALLILTAGIATGLLSVKEAAPAVPI